MNAGSAGPDVAAPPKADPAALALRGRPRPAVRFRRGLVIGIAGAAAAALATVTWLALEPPGLRLADAEEGESEPAPTGVPETLAGAPVSYGEVPPLFVSGEEGGTELVNYRLRGRYYVVDRLFERAELRLGARRQDVVRIVRIAAWTDRRDQKGCR